MKIPAIRKLVKTYSLEELLQAEADILEEKTPSIEVEGDDEGEQLTHLIGSIEILRNIDNGMKESEALRAFTLRVRNSIS
ncbi:DUF6952 family protein [Phaeocystidibacter luteus]|uniref:Uncharacterized protein n=1 Tax=Phaeocystidibacter luteus TaxID=911197 RepID=A0A6N6RMC3_9FLAO|nr:hypothetical protein [Phaeocystidibacter luteus]KAB2814719.1 hypothetical protein F8C67_02955 [Phaeocystidibacter luteus]NVK28152.1 hypothetical protein [Flavobacteriia bacterium]